MKSLSAALVFLLLASGCATSTVELKPSHLYGTKLETKPLSWHQLRFRWHWPEEDQPLWHLDLLVADGVLSNLITRYGESLPLWRFHRRAGRDAAGHQFSFIFYSSEDLATDIADAARNHELTKALTQAGKLKRVYMTTPDRSDKLLATSDSVWPRELQNTWPMFIMGVSQTWLGLVEIHAGDPPRVSPANLDVQVGHYLEVNRKMDEVWARYGQHAFFHHISGVFGYRALHMRF